MISQAYVEFSGKTCVVGTAVIGNVLSLRTWKWCAEKAKQQSKLTRSGGNGRSSLIEFSAFPENYRNQIKAAFGEPKEVHNALLKYFKIDSDARHYFDGFKHANGKSLSPEQISKYTTNASVLNAIASLKMEREMLRKRSGNSKRGVWATLLDDLKTFNDSLKRHYNGLQHTLPLSEKRVKKALSKYKGKQANNYLHLIDGRAQNTNNQKVTPEMLQLWNSMFARARLKPNYLEVAALYERFLNGTLEVVNIETGEAYDRNAECYVAISESSVYAWLEKWETRAATHLLRSGDRQKYSQIYKVYHKLKQPEFAGSIISVDDRQPPFKYTKQGNRVWFYNGIDLGSEAFTCWVYGDTKEGIIVDFYRQMVRNYTEWGFNLPMEIECEMSLNSGFQQTLLQEGAMFKHVRIEANNARGKRIEAYYKPLRYGLEKKREGWLARPHALSEANQKGAGEDIVIPFDTIVENSLRDIETWNNTPHSNQVLHPNMTRWEVFKEKQLPSLRPTNWKGILPYIGFKEPSSMKAGRITLQYQHRVVGIDGKVALGENLINIMRQIEGEDVDVYWLDNTAGDEVIKALVYTKAGQYVCELLDDLAYQRATAEQTEDDYEKRELMSAYANTVESFIRNNARTIEAVALVEVETTPKNNGFQIAQLQRRATITPRTTGEVIDEEPATDPDHFVSKKSLYDNF